MTMSQDPSYWTALAAQAQRIADAHVVSEIETCGVPEPRAGLTWYDLRPALSPSEHCAEVIDMTLELLDYARRRGLIVRHAFDHHLVRLSTGAAA